MRATRIPTSDIHNGNDRVDDPLARYRRRVKRAFRERRASTGTDVANSCGTEENDAPKAAGSLPKNPQGEDA